jgi:hypothetical protein
MEALYNSSELAMAAYGNFDPSKSMNHPDNLAALTDDRVGMSQKQAEKFAARYTKVITQHTDPTTGFSVTVFKSATGQLTLAIRGTDDLSLGNDGNDNASIFTYGVAYEQITAMYDWWISTSANGVLAAALAADTVIDVTGHSLGGHLAMAFGSLFATQTADVTVFNAPGFVDSWDNDLFFDGLVSGAAVPTGANTINIIADETIIGDVPWTAVAGLHSRPGTAVDVAIEDQVSSDEPLPAVPAYNHSQQILTDALAVLNLLSQLDSSLGSEDFKSILNASINGTAGSYEGIVDVLESLLGINSTNLPVGNGERDALYTAIYGLLDNEEFDTLRGNVTITNLSSNASNFNVQSSIAYRYALLNLTPFVLEGDATIYDQHTTTGELDYANYSEQFWQARAIYLDFLLLRNSQDSAWNESVNEELADQLFFDVTTGQAVVTGGTYPVTPDSSRRFMFGSDGVDGNADGFSGGTNNDYLFGMGGNDQLDGGEGNDYLEGGTGIDTYLYISGDGHDTIVDSNGVNNIRFNGNPLGSFTALDGDTSIYTSDDPSSNISLIKNGTDLTIHFNDAEGGTVTINDFNASNFDFTINNTMPAPELEQGVYEVSHIKSNSSEGGIWSSYSMRSVEQPSLNAQPLFLDVEPVTCFPNNYSYSTVPMVESFSVYRVLALLDIRKLNLSPFFYPSSNFNIELMEGHNK